MQGIPLICRMRASELQSALNFKQYVSMVSSNLTLPVSFSLWDQCSRWTIHRTKHIWPLKTRWHSLTDCFFVFFQVSEPGYPVCAKKRSERCHNAEDCAKTQPLQWWEQMALFSPCLNRNCIHRKVLKFNQNWGKIILKMSTLAPTNLFYYIYFYSFSRCFYA